METKTTEKVELVWKAGEVKSMELLKGKEKISIDENGITLNGKIPVHVSIDDIFAMRKLLKVIRGYNPSQGWTVKSLTRSMDVLIDEIMPIEKESLE